MVEALLAAGADPAPALPAARQSIWPISINSARQTYVCDRTHERIGRRELDGGVALMIT